jgi:hypothetical protein
VRLSPHRRWISSTSTPQADLPFAATLLEKRAFRVARSAPKPIVAHPKSLAEPFPLNHPEIIKLQKYLQIKFNNRAIDVRPRNRQNDSVEVYLGEEFLGLIYVDDEDGDKSYNFQMAILEEDLAEVN